MNWIRALLLTALQSLASSVGQPSQADSSIAGSCQPGKADLQSLEANSRVADDCLAAASSAFAAATSSDDPLAEAKALMATEAWQPAADAFLRFLRKQPNASHAPEATFWVGYCLVKEQKFEQAIRILQPFEDKLASEKWADDALHQLGRAYANVGESELALAVWRRLLENYSDSIWRGDAMANIVNLLYAAQDFAACLPYCEQLTEEASQPGTQWDTRYIGAYCLNALGRFDDAERWIERWFDPTSPVEEAWRTLLGAQRDLLSDREEQAMRSVEALGRDFPDLDRSSWLDVLLRTSTMLRQNGRGDRARPLLVGAMPRLSDQPLAEIGWLLDELNSVIGPNRSQDYLDELARVIEDTSTPPMVRIAVCDRQVAVLRQGGRAPEAGAALREALARESAEFPRFRAALLLAEVTAVDLGDRELAAKLLQELLPTLKRRDFIREIRVKMQEYRPAAGPQ